MEISNAMRKLSGFAAIWLAVFSAAFLAALLLGVDVWGIDDAYIFLVYAEHSADGHGFAYNIGSERVEGFSSMLWQLLLTVLYFFGLSDSFFIGAVTSGLAALSIWSMLDLVNRLAHQEDVWNSSIESRSVPFLYIFFFSWCFAQPAWILWNVPALMDASLWICILSLLLREVILTGTRPVLERNQIVRFTFLLCVSVFTRPEAMAWGVFFIVALAIFLRQHKEKLLPVILYPIVGYFVCLVLLTSFRWFYFGYSLPNTYYAKVSPSFSYNLSQGLDYIGEYMSGGGFAALTAALATAVFVLQLPKVVTEVAGKRGFKLNDERVTYFLSSFVVGSFVVVLLVGGDHFGGWRMLMPIYLVLPVFLLYWVFSAQHRWKRLLVWQVPGRYVALVFALLLVLLTAPVRGAWYAVDRTGLLVEFQVAEEGVAAAAALRRLLLDAGETEMPVVGVTAAGSFKYHWDGQVLDLMGLNSIEMAHNEGDRQGIPGHTAFDPVVFYAHPPEFMLPHVTGWPKAFKSCAQLLDAGSFQNQVLDGLLVSAKFRDLYSYVEQPFGEQKFCSLARKDYLQKLSEGLGGSGLTAAPSL